MSKNFEKYKKNKQISEAYEEARKVQESLALSVLRGDGSGKYNGGRGYGIGAGRYEDCMYNNKEYEGHIAVNDILNKIDAMVRMFERSLQDNNFQESSYKIIEVISNLYDLAQIKMTEAKKQAKSYMEKASGIKNSREELEDVPEKEELEDKPINNKITFKTRSPVSFQKEKEEPLDEPQEQPISDKDM